MALLLFYNGENIDTGFLIRPNGTPKEKEEGIMLWSNICFVCG